MASPAEYRRDKREHARRPLEVVPLEKWGADHWSTFIYAMSCVTGRGGVIDRRRMRCHPKRHPFLAHLPRDVGSSNYPRTRIRDGVLDSNHDDWDCLDDAEAEGLLHRVGTNVTEGIVVAHDAAWPLARWIWKQEQERKPWHDGPPLELILAAKSEASR